MALTCQEAALYRAAACAGSSVAAARPSAGTLPGHAASNDGLCTLLLLWLSVLLPALLLLPSAPASGISPVRGRILLLSWRRRRRYGLDTTAAAAAGADGGAAGASAFHGFQRYAGRCGAQGGAHQRQGLPVHEHHTSSACSQGWSVVWKQPWGVIACATL